jgi:RNA 2',3'-cyclic 3'-phosphodiesterase
MRCFIALPLPPRCRERLAETAELLKARLPESSWLSPETYHLTLAFLGEQGPAGLDCVRRALHAQAGLPSFTLDFKGFGVFPSHGPWHVLVAEFREVGPGLRLPRLYAELNRALAEEAEKAGLAPLNEEWPDAAEPGSKPKRLFKAHITLARARGRAEEKGLNLAFFRGAEAPLCEQTPEGGWPIEACVLYKSLLKPQGAVYTELDRISLGKG